MNYIHITGYKFIFLDQLEKLQQTLWNECRRLNLIGTILISHEGININLAGEREALDDFKSLSKRLEMGFSDIQFKETRCDCRPYKRLSVKLREEIITFQHKDIVPAVHPVPHLEPKLFKQWLDEEQDIVMIDARNDYEIEYGTFEKAHNLHIQQFTDFSHAIAEQFHDARKHQRVVIFCTGGVRCEKAGPAMVQAGYQNVYQLQGGIINYFAQCGAAHYQGECFVFDDRIKIKESDCLG